MRGTTRLTPAGMFDGVVARRFDERRDPALCECLLR